MGAGWIVAAWRALQIVACPTFNCRAIRRTETPRSWSAMMAACTVTDRRNGAGDDRLNGASFWWGERTSRRG